jgi:hypothetical protein
MVQLLEALSFIHQRKIAHLDIKVQFRYPPITALKSLAHCCQNTPRYFLETPEKNCPPWHQGTVLMTPIISNLPILTSRVQFRCPPITALKSLAHYWQNTRYLIDAIEKNCPPWHQGTVPMPPITALKSLAHYKQSTPRYLLDSSLQTKYTEISPWYTYEKLPT